MTPEQAAFFERTTPEPNSGCWIWMRATSGDGYGYVMIGGLLIRAHRWAWELFVGPIPRGLIVCHKCDNPPCVNPEHLFVGTRSENALDAVKKGRVKPPIRPRCAIHDRKDGTCRECKRLRDAKRNYRAERSARRLDVHKP